MRIRHLHHEGLDERLLVLVEVVRNEGRGFLLHPGTGGRQGLGDRERLPILRTVDQPGQRFLQFAVPHRLGLADQDHRVLGQVGAAVDRPGEGLEHVIAVQAPVNRTVGLSIMPCPPSVRVCRQADQ